LFNFAAVKVHILALFYRWKPTNSVLVRLFENIRVHGLSDYTEYFITCQWNAVVANETISDPLGGLEGRPYKATLTRERIEALFLARLFSWYHKRQWATDFGELFQHGILDRFHSFDFVRAEDAPDPLPATSGEVVRAQKWFIVSYLLLL
jgi:hypothetical protein